MDSNNLKGIAFMAGFNPNPDTMKREIANLSIATEMDVLEINFNKYLEAGYSYIEILRRVKEDLKEAKLKGYRYVVAYSLGAPIYTLNADEEETTMDKVVFTSPAFTPVNPLQMLKDHRNPDIKKSRATPKTVNAAGLGYILKVASHANFKLANLVGTPTLTLQGDVDPSVRSRGIKLVHNRLLRLEDDPEVQHSLCQFPNGRHHLLSETETDVQALKLVNAFFKGVKF